MGGDRTVRIFLIITILLCSVTYSYTNPSPHKTRFNSQIERVENIVGIYFPEHVSRPLAKVATARQILEDGLNKGPDYSCAGTGVGGENERILKATVFHWLKVGRASDGEGTFYTLKGEGAAVCSAVIIAKLYDTFVYRFLKKHQEEWERAKGGEVINVQHIVERADRCYGPGHEALRRIYGEVH